MMIKIIATLPKPYEHGQVRTKQHTRNFSPAPPTSFGTPWLLGQTKLTEYKSTRWQFAMITIDADEPKKSLGNCIFGMRLSVLSQCDSRGDKESPLFNRVLISSKWQDRSFVCVAVRALKRNWIANRKTCWDLRPRWWTDGKYPSEGKSAIWKLKTCKGCSI